MVEMLTLMIIGTILIVGGILVLVYAKRKIDKASLLFDEANDKIKNAKRDIDTERREATIRLKDELHKKMSLS